MTFSRVSHFALVGLIASSLTMVSFPCPAVCLDGHPSVAAEAAKSSLVVVGTARESHTVPDVDDPSTSIYTIYVVDIQEVIKGAAQKQIWIFDENSSGRFPMDIGKPNLLFIHHYPSEDVVDSCGNSGPMTEKQNEYIMVKGQETKARPSVRP
jgi:hypothetical protein